MEWMDITDLNEMNEIALHADDGRENLNIPTGGGRIRSDSV